MNNQNQTINNAITNQYQQSIFSLITNQIDYWCLVVTVPLGIILNLISIFVFIRLDMVKSTMSFLYINLSVSNAAVLVYYLFVMNSKIIMDYELSKLTDIGCKITIVIRRVLRSVPTWIEALITLDRYLAVCYPNRFDYIFKSKRNLFIIIILIIFLLICLNWINFLYFLGTLTNTVTIGLSLNQNHSTNFTYLSISDRKCMANNGFDLIGDLCSSLVKTLLPGILIFIWSILIIRRIRLIKKNLYKIGDSTTSNLKERHLIIALLCMNLMFFILNFPVLILAIIRHIYGFIVGPKNQNKIVQEILGNLYLFTYDIANLYYILMFVQFLVFNKIFKKEFLMIISGLIDSKE